MRDRIIVIGASTDGIPTLSRLVRQLPATLGAAVFIVQHTSGHSPGELPHILERHAHMPVVHAAGGQRIERGTIYVAPPDHHVLIEPGSIQLSKGPKENYVRPAVDVLFRSAALAYGAAVIGVVLTGYLNDGTAGLLAIKDRGGVTVVQDPDEAAAPGMPLSALANVPIDHLCRLNEIGPLLVRLAAESPAGDRPYPPEVELENELAAGVSIDAALAQLLELATPTALTCAVCGSAVYVLPDQRFRRYRCRSGHAFSDAGLSTALESMAPPVASDAVSGAHVRPAHVA